MGGYTLKKAVNLLCLLAVLAIACLIALDFLAPQDRRDVFLSRCVFGVLLFCPSRCSSASFLSRITGTTYRPNIGSRFTA